VTELRDAVRRSPLAALGRLVAPYRAILIASLDEERGA
jgi:hypothetical protein